jgi:APA family basic amino acid/polyamine antiporter
MLTLLVAGSMHRLSGIFIVTVPGMGRDVGGPGWMLALWVVAGIITILAALSYGELAGIDAKCRWAICIS